MRYILPILIGENHTRSDPYIHQMRNGWDRLLLHHGGGTEQRPGRDKEDILQLSPAHRAEDMTAQHRRAASAARAARVDVLTLGEYHNAAVAVTAADIHTLFSEQIRKQPRSDAPEVAGDDPVIVARPRARPLQKPKYGVRSSW